MSTTTNDTKQTTPRFTPGQSVTWISAPGGRRRLRGNVFAGLSRLIPATVVNVGAKLVTIEAEGRRRRVKARNLREADEARMLRESEEAAGREYLAQRDEEWRRLRVEIDAELDAEELEEVL